ncbi:hypothetical protein [Jannaschia rubra]|uniref:hypothetical protein n=1 Tax=Jannaschia rubra TaxID=282197 RepID=UPI002491D679|nr:hypothetical protein [Jannaschia rubra]
MIVDDVSPPQEKQRRKRHIRKAKSFGQFGEREFQKAPTADSTRAMRRSILDRELMRFWQIGCSMKFCRSTCARFAQDRLCCTERDEG